MRNKFFGTLFNTYNFFALYANLDGWTPGEGREPVYSELDRWIRARLAQVVDRVTACLEDYDPYGATLAVEPLLDDLTNWYIRRSRRRFWRSRADDQ